MMVMFGLTKNFMTDRKDFTQMLHIKFRYKDQFTNGQWQEQECICNSIQECKDFYGLDYDCEYEILSVEEVK